MPFAAFPLLAVLASPQPALVQETLPNGLEISILADPGLKVVATQVWYHVGSADEKAGQRGLAHLFEHLMFGPTATRPAREWSDWHHRFGGDDNAFTTPDETVYVSEMPVEGHSRVLEMEADRMAHLAVTPETVGNEIKIVTEELRLRTENDPAARALVKIQRALLGEHPYAYDPSGTKDDIAKVTPDAARAFYGEHYHPNRAHLVVAGPVDPQATLAAVREAFGPLPAGGVDDPPIPALDTWPFPPEIAIREDIPPVEIAAVGVPLPAPDAPDAPALTVLVHLLQGGATDLFREDLVVKRARAVEGGTQVLQLRRGGALAFWAASLPYRRKATAFRDLDAAIDRLGTLDWLTDAAVVSAKRALRRDLVERAWTAQAQADAIGRARWWLGDARRAFDEADRLQAVTRDDVARAFRAHVASPRKIRLYVQPEHVPVLVRLFGWLYPLVAR